MMGFGFNCILAAVQGSVGWYCHSAALTSDAVHTFSDSMSDIVALAAVKMVQRPVSDAWPVGLGKADPLAALGVGGMMLASGGTALVYSLRLLSEALGGDATGGMDMGHGHGHGHSHGHSHGGVASFSDGYAGYVGMATCVFTMAGKEGLFQMTRRVATRLNSNILLANAWHHRSDALGSGLVLAGLVGRTFVHSALDPISGAIVAGIVVRISLGIGRRAMLELLDQGLPEAERDKLRGEVAAAMEEMRQVEAAWREHGLSLRHLNGRRAGPDVFLQVHLRLDGGPEAWRHISAQQVGRLEHAILARLRLETCPGAREVRAIME